MVHMKHKSKSGINETAAPKIQSIPREENLFRSNILGTH